MKKSFKKIVSIFLVTIMVFGVAPLSELIGFDFCEQSFLNLKAEAATYTGKCGENLTWSLNESTGELVISGTGQIKHYYTYSESPWYNYRSSIKSIIINNGVTRIANYSFYGCEYLENISIPDSVTSMGSLSFVNCKKLASITIPDSVTEIGDRTFQGCESLKSITIPYGVEYISNQQFYGCKSLESVIIPDSVTSISNNAFSKCESLKTIVIPEGVKSIPDYAFSECKNLSDITLGNNITKIGTCAFSQCYNIKNVYYPGTPEQWEEIPVAQGNDNLINNLIFESNSEKPYYTWGMCGDNINWKFCVNGELIIYGTGKMYDWNTSSNRAPWFNEANNIKSVTISNGVSSIGDFAFAGCENIIGVSLPESVNEIGDSTFSDCNILSNVYYSGTEKEWAEIIIGSSNENLCDSTIHYKEPVTVIIEAYTKVDGSAAWSKQFGISISSDDENAPLPDVTYSVIDNYGCVSFPILITEEDLHGLENKSFNYTLTISSANGKKYDFSPETQTVEVTINNTNGKLTQTNSVDRYDFVGYSYYDYAITLTWDDHDDVCGVRPNIVEMVLVSNQSDESIPITLSKENGWRTVLSVRETNDEFKYHRYSIEGLNSDVGYMFDIYPYEDIYRSGVNLTASLSVCMVGFYTTQGTSTEKQYVVSGSLAAKPEDPESDYYNFIGWYKDEDCTQGQEWDFETDVIFKDTILYAKWEAKPIEITLKTDYGIFEGNETEVTITIPACSAVGIKLSEEIYDSNYNHIGWVDEDGNVITATTKLYENTTLYAVWQKKPYYDSSINIKNNTGSKTINYGETLKLSINTTNLPDGSKIYWYVDGVKKAEGEVFEISFEGGTKVVTVKIIGFDGNVLKDVNGNEISDSEAVTVKAGFFQKLISFFKNLFGSNRTVVQAIFKGVF